MALEWVADYPQGKKNDLRDTESLDTRLHRLPWKAAEEVGTHRSGNWVEVEDDTVKNYREVDWVAAMVAAGCG